jgi:myo-inositol-1(or 4)-monophosphatase
MEPNINFLLKIVTKAGNELLKFSGKVKEYQIKKGNPKDIVTEADKYIEKFIINEINKKFPEHTIIAEESGKSLINPEKIWYIDPIDGTTNFLHNFPIYGISIGYQEFNEMKLAAIYFPALKELFYAEKGKGAYKNKKRIFVSNQTDINNALLATGFACLRSGLKENNLKYFNKIITQVRDIRRTGSATFDLCSVATGRLDGFWEINLSSWDVMAGFLIVQEAGGKVTDFNDTPNFNQNRQIVASNGKIHKDFLKFFK